MKKCIWCKESENSVLFKKRAHTVPQSLGGKNICDNVCDTCNHYFGNYDNGKLPIETAIKETFNISRYRLLDPIKEFGKNKSMPKFSSNYFQVNFQKNEISPKGKYKLVKDFQETLGRQLKRGIYKMFLEELERQKGIAHNPKFDFIREFSRYNEGDYPLFYFERKHSMILLSKEWVKDPEIIMNSDYQMKYLYVDDSFFEFDFLGHVFGIPIDKSALVEDKVVEYFSKTAEKKSGLFNSVLIVKKFYEIDFTLRILNDPISK
jgi:hypothetical protein